MGLVQDTATFIKDAWDAVEEMGGDVPAGGKNLANLAAGIASIPTGPSLKGLKKALQDGIAPTQFPVGMEIPDTWSGNDNPLIVTQYLNSSNNSSYGGVEGVILIRKFIEPISQQFGSSNVYTNSLIKTFLETDYVNNCSDELKTLISNISIEYDPYSSPSTKLPNQKWFLMSAREVCNAGAASSVAEGIMWDYWKQKTGLSAIDNINTPNTGRIMKDRNGTPQNFWIRSYGGNTSELAVAGTNGSVYSSAPGYAYGVLPACFIGKD